MSIKGTRTEQNLLKAFAGESQARNRYHFFASTAKSEGFDQICGLFLETADNETRACEGLLQVPRGRRHRDHGLVPGGQDRHDR